MLRNEWEFLYHGEDLAKAAGAKVLHHSARLIWWENQKKIVMEKVKADGLEIDESQADLILARLDREAQQVPVFGQRGPTVNIRADLLRDLQECASKIKEHRAKVGEYEGWVAVMTAQPTAHLRLHHDDWLFFFGK